MKGIAITPEFRTVSASELQKFWRKSSTGMPKQVKRIRICFVLVPRKK